MPFNKLTILASIAFLAANATQAQWQIQTSNTAADLRGVHNVGNGVAWASGTNGTVLRTEDGGYVWQTCAIPSGAEKLDFRGIQAFDANTAIVMSSDKGDLSRLYKTTDGCHTWKLIFTNPDKGGFWDALRFVHATAQGSVPAHWEGLLVGDPVDNKFAEFESSDNGDHWKRHKTMPGTPIAKEGEALFAASNGSMIVDGISSAMLATGGMPGARSIVLTEYTKHDPRVSWAFAGGAIPLAKGESAGAFAIARAPEMTSTDTANVDPEDKWRLLWIA